MKNICVWLLLAVVIGLSSSIPPIPGWITKSKTRPTTIRTTASSVLVQKWKDGPNGVKWDKDCDFNGHDLSFVTQISDSECMEQCFLEKDCTHWMYTFWNKRCCLKNSDRELRETYHTDAKCGFVPERRRTSPELRNWKSDGSNGKKWDLNCNFNGRDIKCFNKLSDCSRCMDRCLKNEDCTHWTFLKMRKRCCIKSITGHDDDDSAEFREVREDGAICGFAPARMSSSSSSSETPKTE